MNTENRPTAQTGAPPSDTPSGMDNVPTRPLPPDASPVSAPLGTLHPLLAKLLGRKEDAPDLLGRYRILRLLGQGGMGAVFLAEDTVAHRRVALKFMKPGALDAQERFLREARSAAALEDDHVVRIYHVDEVDGVPYIVMPFLEGESLEARLHRAGSEPLPLAEIVQIGREAAAGLAAAHARGLIHRDIKPANLWLERKANAAGFRTLVLDFGLARPCDGVQLTQTGSVLGTPGYMAPEQADGLPLDHRADLFSLGCVFYRMSAGRPAFQGKTLTALLRAVAEHDPPPAHQVNANVPPALSDLILHMLAKDPDKRPASAREVMETLANIRLRTMTPAWRPWVADRRSWVAAALLLILMVIGVAWMLSRPRPEGKGDDGPGPPPPVAFVQKGFVDIRVWRDQKGGAIPRRLSDPEAPLPLHKGDQFRIEAKVDTPAYLYLLWIDTEGKAVPIYPWQPGQWGARRSTRPAQEEKVTRLSLPPKTGEGYTIDDDTEGMETLLLLARETPLPATADVELQKLLSGLPKQHKTQNARSVVWFRNWGVDDDEERRTISFSTSKINDPVLQLQSELRERLHDLASFSSAVSFARLGEKK